jgi:hypothetical protein
MPKIWKFGSVWMTVGVEIGTPWGSCLFGKVTIRMREESVRMLQSGMLGDQFFNDLCEYRCVQMDICSSPQI